MKPLDPVNPEEEYDVIIAEIATNGDGLTRVNGIIVFVPNSVVGEKCKVKIRSVKPNYANAVKIQDLEEMEAREDPNQPKEIEDEYELVKIKSDEPKKIEVEVSDQEIELEDPKPSYKILKRRLAKLRK